MHSVCVCGVNENACKAVVVGVGNEWRPTTIDPASKSTSNPKRTVVTCLDVTIEFRILSARTGLTRLRASDTSIVGLMFVMGVDDAGILDADVARNLFLELITCPLMFAVPVCVMIDYAKPQDLYRRKIGKDLFVSDYLSLWTTVPRCLYELSIIECCTAYGTNCSRAVRWTLERAAAVVRCG